MSQAEALASRRCTVPAGLVSSRGKLVYLYLSMYEEASLEQMAEDLGLPLITLCDLLRTLEARGYVEEQGERYSCCS